MGSEWTTVGSVATVYDGPHATPRKTDEGPYFLSISSLENGKLDLSKSARLSEEEFAKWTRRVTPIAGDVLFSYETRLGEAALMPEGIRACLGRRMGLLRPDIRKVVPRYLLFAYLGPDFQKEIRSRTNSGATVDRLSLKELPDFPIRIPPLSEQLAIARVLGTLDDKIELNHQMNTTLEAMAQALFKSWFVDFDPVIDNALAAGNLIPDELAERAERRVKAAQQPSPEQPHTLPADIRQQFPDRFVFTETMGWVPEGWEVRSLAEVVSLIIDHRGKTPKKLGGDWSSEGHPAISAKNIKNGRIVRPDSIRYVDIDLYTKWMKSPLNRGDIALTSEAPLGELYYFSSRVDYLLSQRLFGIRANAEVTDGCFLYCWLRSERGQSELENRATGTTVVGIRQSELLKTSVLSPPVDIIKQFSSIADPQLSCINSNENHNNALAELRDTLLPKLLSGQLRVPDAEQLLAEAL